MKHKVKIGDVVRSSYGHGWVGVVIRTYIINGGNKKQDYLGAIVVLTEDRSGNPMRIRTLASLSVHWLTKLNRTTICPKDWLDGTKLQGWEAEPDSYIMQNTIDINVI